MYTHSVMQLAGAVQFGVYQVETLKIVRDSSVRSDAALYASGTEINPCVRRIHSSRLGHKTISKTILPLPLIQKEHRKVCTLSTRKLPSGGLPRNDVVVTG